MKGKKDFFFFFILLTASWSFLVSQLFVDVNSCHLLFDANLPWFMDLTFQVPMQYCSLQHWTLLPSPVTSTLGIVLLLFCLFILSVVISPLISCSILGTYWPGEFIFQCPIFLPFHTVHGVLKARILKWFANSRLQWTTFYQNSPPWPVHRGWPYMAWLIVSLS